MTSHNNIGRIYIVMRRHYVTTDIFDFGHTVKGVVCYFFASTDVFYIVECLLLFFRHQKI